MFFSTLRCSFHIPWDCISNIFLIKLKLFKSQNYWILVEIYQLWIALIKKKPQLFHAQAYTKYCYREKLTYHFGMRLICRHQSSPLYLMVQEIAQSSWILDPKIQCSKTKSETTLSGVFVWFQRSVIYDKETGWSTVDS